MDKIKKFIKENTEKIEFAEYETQKVMDIENVHQLVLKVGTKLTGKYFPFIAEILAINETDNLLSVKICRGENDHTEEWDFNITLFGLEVGEYTIIP